MLAGSAGQSFIFDVDSPWERRLSTVAAYLGASMALSMARANPTREGHDTGRAFANFYHKSTADTELATTPN